MVRKPPTKITILKNKIMELKEIEQIKSQLNDKGIENDSVLAISIEKVIESQQKQIEELKKERKEILRSLNIKIEQLHSQDNLLLERGVELTKLREVNVIISFKNTELKQQLEQREEKLLLDLLEWLSDSNEHNIRKSELSQILEDYLDYKQIKQ